MCHPLEYYNLCNDLFGEILIHEPWPMSINKSNQDIQIPTPEELERAIAQTKLFWEKEYNQDIDREQSDVF